ncbi:MAG: acyl-CoA dehydrogenase family protein [Paenibacillaceae bacterium]
MNDITQMLIQSTTKIMKDVCTKELVNKSEQGIWAGDLWDTLADSGMITVGVPEELGGVDCSYQDAFNILRLAGKFSAPIPLAETFIGNWLLANLGEQVSDEPLTVALPKRDDWINFQKEDDGWVISGEACAVPWGRYAKWILLIGRFDSEHVLALVRPQHGRIEYGQNLAGEARDTIIFEDVLVKDCRVISIEIENVMNQLLYSGALTRMVMMAGALERVLELSVAYTTERSQFGKPIHRFQAIQHQLALLAGESAAASTAADYAVKAYQANSFLKEIAMAKIRINEAVGLAAPIAHQIHGAIGFTYEHTLHQSTRRLWSWRDEFGTEVEWGERLATQLMEIGQDGLWPLITDSKRPNFVE